MQQFTNRFTLSNWKTTPVSYGWHTAGDTKDSIACSVKLNKRQEKKWQKDFDRLDVASKDGVLSEDEICKGAIKDLENKKRKANAILGPLCGKIFVEYKKINDDIDYYKKLLEHEN